MRVQSKEEGSEKSGDHSCRKSRHPGSALGREREFFSCKSLTVTLMTVDETNTTTVIWDIGTPCSKSWQPVR